MVQNNISLGKLFQRIPIGIRHTELYDRSSLSIIIPGGNIVENESNCGITHFVEHLTSRRVDRFNDFDSQNKYIQQNSIYNYARTSWENVLYRISFKDSAYEKAIDYLFETLTNVSSFSEEDIKRVKGNILIEKGLSQDDTINYSINYLIQRFWEGTSSPFKFPTIGTIDTIKNFTPTNLLDFRNKLLSSNSISMGYSGRLPLENIENALSKYSNILTGNNESVNLDQNLPQVRNNSWVIENNKLDLTYVSMGYMFEIDHNSKFKLSVQLLKKLIDRALKGDIAFIDALTYKSVVHSFIFRNHIWLIIIAPTLPEMAKSLIERIQEEINTICENPYEFERSKQLLKNEINSYDLNQWSEFLSQSLFYDDNYVFENDLISNLDSITQEELGILSKKLLSPANCSILRL